MRCTATHYTTLQLAATHCNSLNEKRTFVVYLYGVLYVRQCMCSVCAVYVARVVCASQLNVVHL